MNDGQNTQKVKRPDIGLRQAKRLCQMPHNQRLAFIAEGLPIILGSAQGFWKAAEQLGHQTREATVMEGFATEEAAKILILMDVVRCPPKLIASRLNQLMKWFYDHLARGIYAEATDWRPMDLAQLRSYVDSHRQGHYTEGYAGEYIMPNWTVYGRESALYADVELLQDDTLIWCAPRQPVSTAWSFNRMPAAMRVAEAMQQLGLFTEAGLRATSVIWSSLEYRDKESHHEGRRLTQTLLETLQAEDLLLPTAEQVHVTTLYDDWQIPMYNLDFSLIPVSLEKLQAEQESEYWAMAGDPY